MNQRKIEKKYISLRIKTKQTTTTKKFSQIDQEESHFIARKLSQKMLHMSTDTFILNAIILREKILKKYNKLINCWFFRSLFLNYKKKDFFLISKAYKMSSVVFSIFYSVWCGNHWPYVAI